MADADEDVSHLGTQDGAENDPTEETQDFRFLDRLMCAHAYHFSHFPVLTYRAEAATM